MQIMSQDGEINNEKALIMLPDATAEMINDCEEEMNKGKDICEKAYFITRCVMTRVLVDGRSKDEK